MGEANLKDLPIGVFDSGVGGLTVAREIMRQIPNERIVYFGDTARVPYGSKSKETVTKYSRQIVRFLKTQNVKAIVIACNTASAYALEQIEKEVIATEGTISSQIYTQYIKNLKEDAQVLGKACPLFVPLVEEGLLEDPVTDEIAQRYLSVLIDSGIDTLILGCTHYPLIRSTVGRIMGEKVTLVNPAYETAIELKRLLEEKNMLQDTKPALGTNQYQFFVSDGAEKFQHFANTIFKYGILAVKQINIEEY